MKILSIVLILGSLSASQALAQISTKTTAPLVLQRKIVLTGVKGKFDHFAIDETNNRLFVAATGNKSVEVIDLTSEKTRQSLTGMGKPHGLAWVPALGRLFVSDGEKAELDVYEGEPLKLVKSMGLSEDADDMVYDGESGLLYVGHGGTDTANPASVAVVDARHLEVVKQLQMAAHPEGLELHVKGRRVFINVSETGEVVVVDGRTQVKAETWKLRDTKGNTPLAYDDADDLLLVGCRTPSKLLVLSGNTGRELDSASIATGADDLFYEAKTHRVYVVTGSGSINSFAVSTAGKLETLPVTQTAAGAKTGLLVPSQGALYIGVPGIAGLAEIDVYQTSAAQ